jgi:hypothetical protein
VVEELVLKPADEFAMIPSFAPTRPPMIAPLADEVSVPVAPDEVIRPEEYPAIEPAY